MKTQFKVFHHNNTELGTAVMSNRRVSYKCDPKVYAWFEERSDQWLRDFQTTVRKLCRSLGHTGKYCSSKCENTGIEVERL